MRSRAICIVAAVLMCGVTVRPALAAPVPAVFPVTITASTLAAMVNPYRFTFALYDAAVGGTRLWSESKSYRLPASKKVTHQLGSVNPAINPISPLFFDRQLWVEASAAGKTFPRVKLTVVPYAVRSEMAGNIEGQITAGQVDATGAASGDVLTANGDGAASWQPPASGGTVTAVTAGAGLTGGTITTSGELAVDTGAIQARVGGTCAEGSSIRSIAADGTVVCEPDDAGGGSGTVTKVDTGTGLTGGPVTGVGEIAIDPAVVPRLGASNTFTGAQAVQTGGAAAVGLTVQGAPAQSANLQEWKNSAGAALAAVGPSGAVTAVSFSGSGAGLTGVNAATLGGQAPSAFAGATHAHSGAEITTGTVATARLSVGTAAGTVAAGDHEHDADYVNEGQDGSVTSGMIVDGTIALTDLGQNSCDKGQLLKWEGEAWACAADADADTGVNAVTNGGGITGSIAGRTLTLGSDATVQRRSVAPACPDGQYLRAVAADGTPTCAADGTGLFAGWSVTGNAGTNPAKDFIGTTDDVPFEVRVNNQRALRLEQAVSGAWVGQNTLGGDGNNWIGSGVTIGTIAGGGGIIGAPYPNRVTDLGGTVGGGLDNQAGNNAGSPQDAVFATVAGGDGNRAGGSRSTVAGGTGNQATGDSATVGGGQQNWANGQNAAIGGGDGNHALGNWAVVGGGQNNQVSGRYSVVMGGGNNLALGNHATVGGGASNWAGGDFSFAAGRSAMVRAATDLGDADGDQGTFIWADATGSQFVSTGPNQFLIRAAGGVGINTNSPQAALHVAGDVRIDGALQHDFALRQKVNLWGEKYGIGVQNGRQYFRADAGQGFVWFAGGSHSDTADDPGPSGTLMMSLAGSGLQIGSTLGVGGDAAVGRDLTVGRTLDVSSALNVGVTAAVGGPMLIGGNLTVGGTITKGGGAFKIDHPLDPRNQYLSHSFVESPDMKNIYDGVVTTDARGYATVELPAWFGALNRDFRYQLTVVDEADGEGFVQAKVVRGVAENRFTIRTSAPGVTVSWQVTGIRQDPYANAHRIPVEEEKPVADRGMCLHAEACGERLAQER